MLIKKIRISNFKSFKDLEVELGNFNVLIGANASGKSNFIQIFKFLRDIVNHGLENAIFMQGGVEYLRNIKIRSSKNFLLDTVLKNDYIFPSEKNNIKFEDKVYELNYKFGINFKEKGLGYDISKDEFIWKSQYSRLNSKKKKIDSKNKLGKVESKISVENQKVNFTLENPDKIPIGKYDIFPKYLEDSKLPKKNILLELDFIPFIASYAFKKQSKLTISSDFPIYILPGELQRNCKRISIYDFDPKLSKKSIPITGKADLEEDASNLSIVLRNIIMKDKEKKRKFLNLMQDLLPFVENIGTTPLADKSLFIKLREIYSKKEYLHSSLISDGTINIAALIIALYFQEKQLVIIEEPERNIHPYLISKVVEMMKEASGKKQIIVSTHNPEVVKHADLEDILLISRDKDGFSTIYRPADKDDVKDFLKK